MTGISAFVNGVPREMFNALAEDEEEAQALHGLYQARQAATNKNLDGMEPGDLAG